jgi:Ca2+-binding EF-hand superfamily protein
MNLSKEIIDAIYFHRGVLINELRAADINNTGMISPNEIMMSFIKASIHKELTSHLIMDIINIYLPSKTDKIDFMKLIAYFLKDLKTLIENKNTKTNKEKEKEKDHLNSNTKRSINKSSVDFFKSNSNLGENLPILGSGNGIEHSYISNECN